MYYDSFCKIFIDADVDYKDLFNKILMFMGGKKEAVNYIVSDWCEICVKCNDEYSYDATNFLNWKYYLDVESISTGKQTSPEYIDGILQLITFLKEFSNSVIPACDFEDEL